MSLSPSTWFIPERHHVSSRVSHLILLSVHNRAAIVTDISTRIGVICYLYILTLTSYLFTNHTSNIISKYLSCSVLTVQCPGQDWEVCTGCTHVHISDCTEGPGASLTSPLSRWNTPSSGSSLFSWCSVFISWLDTVRVWQEGWPILCWLLTTDHWLLTLTTVLTNDYWPLTTDTDFWLRTSDSWPLTTDCWLHTADYWLLNSGCWLLTADYWLLTTDCWLLILIALLLLCWWGTEDDTMTDRYLLVSSSSHTSRVRRCDQPFVSIKGARKQNFPKLSLKKETFQISTMHILCMERFSFSSVHCNNEE